MTNTIHTRAMLVSLKLSKWSASKHDKKISAEVAAKHNADSEMGRYTKALLPKGKNSYTELLSAFSELYNEHRHQTLAWSDEGWRVLPTANYNGYTEMVRKYRSRIDALTQVFIQEYPTLREQVRLKVNGMFNPADYPDPMDLRKKFGVKVDYNPLPAGEDFRIDLSTDALAEIARDTEDRVNRAIADAQRDAVDRLHECVSKIAERLSDPKNSFHDSLIENARDLTDVLTRLNVTDDPRLEEMRIRVEKLAKVAPEALRTLPFQRKSTAHEADAILADMTAIFGGHHV
jgi:hypothetical protein